MIGTTPPLILDLIQCVTPPTAARLPLEKRRAALWADLADRDAAVAFRAICWLAAHPDEALPLLAKHLRPAPKRDAAELRRLIADLDDDEFKVRQMAEANLQSAGRAAEQLLGAVMADRTSSAEQRRRAHRLLAAIRSPEPTEEQRREELRQLRALQALQWIDARQARRHLRDLADGNPYAPLTRYALDAASRLP